MKLFDRKWGWASWQNLNEDRKGKPKGWPHHGRAWLHIGKESAHVEWNLRSTSCGFSFRTNRDCEDTLSGHVAFPPIAIYVGVDLTKERLLSRIASWISKKSVDMFDGRDSGYSGSELSLRVHDWAIWWNVFCDDRGWTNTRPRWRDGCWHPLGRHMRQGEPKVIEERDVLVPMPERAYKATARLEEVRFGHTRLPRFLDRTSTSVEIKMKDGEQIPFPGKGTAFYNCGQDAAFGIYSLARTIEDGVGKMVSSVLRDRRRYPL